ncbi:hypothetical protein A2U01_0071356, partial [Trifolium medium]|nr:hypothetical protein [Trifolium medium]
MSRSSSIQEENIDGSGGELQHGSEECEEHGSDSGESCRRLPGIELAVVLLATNVNSGQSGVRVLMEEHVLLEVESPLDPREDHDCKVMEAKKLIEIQQELG